MARRVEEDSGIDTRRLATLARHLRRAYPVGSWWPFDDPFEIAISAVLTQQTRWAAVLPTMAALRSRHLLSPRALGAAPRGTVERILRPTGFYRQKAKAVQGIARIIVERFDGSIDRAFRLPTPALRRELLSWPGVGEETADSILLYAASRPVFVVDAYTYRLMERFGAARQAGQIPYSAVAAGWSRATKGGAPAFKAMHGAVVELCKAYCTRLPHCADCPLEDHCPKVGVALAR